MNFIQGNNNGCQNLIHNEMFDIAFLMLIILFILKINIDNELKFLKNFVRLALSLVVYVISANLKFLNQFNFFFNF